MRSLAVNAAKGLQRSQRLFAELLATTERENRRLHDQWMDIALTYKIEWDKELARRERLGITGPEPLPHPDHVVIDIRAGTAHIRGPATKEEKAQLIEHRQLFKDELEELEAMLDDPNCEDREALVEEIEKTKKVLAFLATLHKP
jgi:hypothetical protein